MSLYRGWGKNTGFKCSKCGEVEPSVIYDSCPAQADCPICGEHMISTIGIKLLTEEEGRKLRPELYKEMGE